MMYLIRHTNQNFFGRNNFKIFAIFLFILIFAIIVSTFGPVRSVLSDALSPFFKTGNFFYASLGRIPNFFVDNNKLMEENSALKSQVEDLQNSIADYQSIKYENDKLREELGIKPSGNFVAASVVARSPQIPLDSLLLNKGSKDGINNGDFVLAGERVLIGKISRAGRSSATVALNSFAGALSYGYVARTSEPLEINGVGGGSIEAKVPIDFDIEVGDKIMATGPVEFIIAVVGSVEEDQSSGFKNILMSLPANVSKMSIAFVEPAINE